MADINGRREPARSTIDVDRAFTLKRTGISWREVGRILAIDIGRAMPFTAGGVVRAIRDAGRWDERPK